MLDRLQSIKRRCPKRSRVPSVARVVVAQPKIGLSEVIAISTCPFAPDEATVRLVVTVVLCPDVPLPEIGFSPAFYLAGRTRVATCRSSWSYSPVLWLGTAVLDPSARRPFMFPFAEVLT